MTDTTIDLSEIPAPEDLGYTKIVEQLENMSGFQLRLLWMKMQVGALEDDPGYAFTAGDLVDELIRLQRGQKRGATKRRVDRALSAESMRQALAEAFDDFGWGINLCLQKH